MKLIRALFFLMLIPLFLSANSEKEFDEEIMIVDKVLIMVQINKGTQHGIEEGDAFYVYPKPLHSYRDSLELAEATPKGTVFITGADSQCATGKIVKGSFHVKEGMFLLEKKISPNKLGVYFFGDIHWIAYDNQYVLGEYDNDIHTFQGFNVFTRDIVFGRGYGLAVAHNQINHRLHYWFFYPNVEQQVRVIPGWFHIYASIGVGAGVAFQGVYHDMHSFDEKPEEWASSWSYFYTCSIGYRSEFLNLFSFTTLSFSGMYFRWPNAVNDSRDEYLCYEELYYLIPFSIRGGIGIQF